MCVEKSKKGVVALRPVTASESGRRLTADNIQMISSSIFFPREMILQILLFALNTVKSYLRRGENHLRRRSVVICVAGGWMEQIILRYVLVPF